MFEATIKAGILKELTNIVSMIINETKLTATSDCISIRAVDLSHIAMVDLTLASKAFAKYNAEKTEFGIDLKKIDSVLKLAKDENNINLHYVPDKNRLIIEIENITRHMSLIDISSLSQPKLPNVNLQSKICVNTFDIDQGIRASLDISHQILLTLETDRFELSAEGENDLVKLSLPRQKLKELVCSEPVSSLFSLDLLSKMVKAIKSETVTIYLGMDYPIKLEFDFAENNGHVIYLLAPRVKEE